jgi:uncharacterized protein YjbI with pentapeptide repeats
MTDSLPTSPPEAPGYDEQQKKIEQEIIDLRMLTIVSERRPVPALMQLRKYWPNRKTTEKEEFNHALQAFGWTMFSLVFLGGGSGGFLTLVVAAVTVYLAYTANGIATSSNGIATQSNDLIERQIAVEDAARRANVSNELTAILDQINTYQIGQPNSRELPSTIVARIQAASQVMLPYTIPALDPSQEPAFYSPERSQLLLALANLQLSDYRPILERADFSFSIVSNLRLVGATAIGGAEFSFCQLRNAELGTDTIVNSMFRFARLEDGKVFKCNFSGSNFSSSTLRNINVSASRFNYCDFRGANLVGISLNKDDIATETFAGSKFEGATVDAAFFRDVLAPLGVSPDQIIIR